MFKQKKGYYNFEVHLNFRLIDSFQISFPVALNVFFVCRPHAVLTEPFPPAPIGKLTDGEWNAAAFLSCVCVCVCVWNVISDSTLRLCACV